MTRFLLLCGAILTTTILACNHKPVVASEPVSFTADILIKVEQSAPPGFWMIVMPVGDTMNKIEVSHYDSLRCVYFEADTVPGNFVIAYGGVNKEGKMFSDYTKLIWAPSVHKNHLNITADSVAVRTRTSRALPCGNDEPKPESQSK